MYTEVVGGQASHVFTKPDSTGICNHPSHGKLFLLEQGSPPKKSLLQIPILISFYSLSWDWHLGEGKQQGQYFYSKQIYNLKEKASLKKSFYLSIFSLSFLFPILKKKWIAINKTEFHGKTITIEGQPDDQDSDGF